VHISRRKALLTTLFGAGGIGLRALATGLPASFLLNPRKALADMPATCGAAAKAQYFIFNTSAGGDPINTSAPGTYEDPQFVHSPDPAMAPTRLTMRGASFTAGKPWSTLPQSVLDRMVFWHIMTNTPVHPKEPNVLALNGIAQHEQFPSLLAKIMAPCLNTIQGKPISLGGQPLTYNGTTLPVILPSTLKDSLGSPAGPLTALQPLRDQTMNQLYSLYKNQATPSQQAYIDQFVTSQQQLRALNQKLLDTLAAIKDDGPDSQILAAVTLIQMNVAPVLVIKVPFGGDNHNDNGLTLETAQTISGVASLVSLMAQLQSAGLTDKVSFLSLNVFGRTAGLNSAGGRDHNPIHQVSLTIGKPFKGGVIGAVGPVPGHGYGCTAIHSTTGAGDASGDISPLETLGAFAQTVLAGVGGDPSALSMGKVISAALA
jgi:hypothetical protein